MKVFIFALFMLISTLAYSQGVGQTTKFVMETRTDEHFTVRHYDRDAFYLEYKCENTCLITRYYFLPQTTIVHEVEEIYSINKLEGVLNFMNMNFIKRPHKVWLDHKDNNRIKLKIHKNKKTFHIFYRTLDDRT